MEEAAHAEPGAGAAESLSLAIEASRESGVRIDLQLAGDLLRSSRFLGHASPWEMAEAAAAELRKIIGISNGLLNHAEFESIFRARWNDLKSATATASRLSYGARIDDEGMSRVALQTTRGYDRRFELARQFGDAVWQQDRSGFGIVSRSKSDRQKFQRAFAHNLLCPFDGLQRVIDVNDPTPEAMSEAAKSFGVNPSVVRNQLVYKGYLPFENASELAETV